MKKSNRLIKKLLGLLMTVLAFTSCENFFSGAEAKEKIDAAVKFANAPTFSTRVFSDAAETIPSGNLEKKVGEWFSVICKPFNDYDFIKWQALYQNSDGEWVPYTDEELNEILDITNQYEKETSFALKKEVSGLLIQPYCYSRPQVISTYPYYEKSGILRDSRISVMFDQDMSTDSIYYTGEQLRKEFKSNGISPDEYEICFYKKDVEQSYDQKITSEKLNETGISDKLYILYDCTENNKPTSIDSITLESKVYGYIACFTDEFGNTAYKTIYKNIQIMDRSKNSMLSHYRAPYFERPDILVIPSEAPSKDNPNAANLVPPTGAQMLATIGSGFHSTYTEENFTKDINIPGNKKWNYYLNSQTDTTSPSIEEFSLTDTSGNQLKTTNLINSSTLSLSYKLNYQTIKDFTHLADGKIKLYIKANDLESGLLDYFQVTLKKCSDTKYGDIFLYCLGAVQYSESFNFTNTNDTTKQYGTDSAPLTIDLNEILRKAPNMQPEQGVYELIISVKDINGNDFNDFTSTSTTMEPYLKRYIILDNQGPNISQIKIETANTPGTLDVSFAPTADLNSAYIRYKKTSASGTYSYKLVNVDKSNTEMPNITSQLTSLVNGATYSVYIEAYDIYGNSYSSSITAASTRPSATAIKTIGTTDSNQIKITWNFPSEMSTTDGTNSGIMIFYGTSNSLANATYDDYWSPSHNTKSATVPYRGTFSPGSTYYIFLVSYMGGRPDASSVKNGTSKNTYYDSTSIKSATIPVPPVTNLKVTSKTTSNVQLSWTKPSGTIDGYKVYKKLSSSSSWPTTPITTINNSSTTTYAPTSLSAGTKYSFRVCSYVGSKLSTYEDVEAYTNPMPVTNLTATAASSTKIDLTWQNPSGEWDGVVILFSTTNRLSSATYTDYWYKSHNRTSCTIPPGNTYLNKNTSYYIWVLPYVGDRPENASQCISPPSTSAVNTNCSYVCCKTKSK